MTKVLAIAGSPRRGGNTDLLLEQVLKGIRSNEVIVNKLVACDLNVEPCTGCNSCWKAGDCRIKDEVQEIYPLLLGADYIIVASPIYFAGIGAHLKALIDRCQAIWARKYILKVPVRNNNVRAKGFFLSTAGLPSGKNVFRGAVSTIKSFFHVLEVDYAGELLCYGIDGSGEIKKHPDLLRQAFELGGRIV